LEIAQGQNKNGERLTEGDLVFEVAKHTRAGAQEEKPELQTFSYPRLKVLDSEKTASQVVDEIVNEHQLQKVIVDV
jgi:hypothetical protein